MRMSLTIVGKSAAGDGYALHTPIDAAWLALDPKSPAADSRFCPGEFVEVRLDSLDLPAAGLVWRPSEPPEAKATLSTSPEDPAVIPLNVREELRASARMIRTWIPEVFPESAKGQVHFVRAVVDSVADAIERALPLVSPDPTMKAALEKIVGWKGYRPPQEGREEDASTHYEKGANDMLETLVAFAKTGLGL